MGSPLSARAGMALAQNAAAMERFAALPEDERERFIRQTRGARTTQDMRLLVASLVTDSRPH